MLWRMKVASFVMAATITDADDAPRFVNVYGKGFPQQTESWSSQSEGATDLLAVVSGTNALAYLENSDAITLRALPSGIVEIQVRSTPSTLDAFATMQWELVLNIESAKNPGAVPRPAA